MQAPTRPEIQLARNGLPSLVQNGTWIHSRYDPWKEACQAAAILDCPDHSRVLLVLNPGLGYLSQALAERFPDKLVLSLYSTLPPAQNELRYPATWHPELQATLEACLSAAAADQPPAAIHVVPWQAGCQQVPDSTSDLIRRIGNWLELHAADQHTARHFFKPWLRNTVRNLLLRPHGTFPARRRRCPVVIAASGPSLAQALPHLATWRKHCLLLALPSSLRALAAASIIPDAIIQSDGGYWAKRHHLPAMAHLPCFAALRSALPGSWPAASPWIPFALSAVEAWLAWLATGQEILPWPDSPTVASQGIMVAARLSTGPILLVGMDLAQYKGQSHALPNSFADQVWLQQCRTRTAQNMRIEQLVQSRPQALHPDSPWASDHVTRLFRQGMIQQWQDSGLLWQYGPAETLIFPSPPPHWQATGTAEKAVRLKREELEMSPGSSGTSGTLLDGLETSRQELLACGEPTTALQAVLAELPPGVYPGESPAARAIALIDDCLDLTRRLLHG